MTNRRTISVILLILIIETYSVLPSRRPTPPKSDFWKGAIHVHSHFSHDGVGTVSEIAEAAKHAGLDFVILTDHDSIGALRAGLEGIHNGVNILVAVEVSTAAGHLLAFFSPKLVHNRTDAELAKLAWEHFLGAETPGLFVATAHPSHAKVPWNRLDRYAEGMEVVNLDSIIQRHFESSPLGLFITLALSPFNQYLAAARFAEINMNDLLAWDGMNSVSPGHFGILGHDTHARIGIKNGVILRWPDYADAFRFASTLIPAPQKTLETFEARRAYILKEIASSHLTLAFSFLYPEEGQDWNYACGSKKYRSGETVSFHHDCAFNFQFPAGFPYSAKIRLIKNGELVEEKVTRGDTAITFSPKGPGQYRLEVWAKMRSLLGFWLWKDAPYLFYNPIYLK